MTYQVATDLVHETSTSTGTGNLTLVAVNGKRDFHTIFGSNSFDYFISSRDAAEWEFGVGHMSDASTIVRDTVVGSSNSNAAVSFSAGTKDVSNDIPATEQNWRGRIAAGAGISLTDSGTGAALTIKSNFVQRVHADYTSYTNFADVIPTDDTIPQNTEGDEILTVSITPKSATNRLRIRFSSTVRGSGDVSGVAALFQDSTASALAANLSYSPSATVPLELVHDMVAGTTSATTFKVRIGPSGNTATIYVNGGASSRLFGGVMKSTLEIEEYTP